MTIPKARKICSILNESNYREWIELAIHCSCRVVEKAVAMANPKEVVPESLKYVSGEILEFKAGVNEEWTDLLARTKDIASQKSQGAVSATDAIFIAMAEYCKRNDPLEKAKRANAKVQNQKAEGSPIQGIKLVPESRYRPADVEHTVNLRDQCRCVYVDENGKRCTERRWLNKHHIKEFADGGNHSPENLETLCWGHHKIKHLKKERLASRDAGVTERL
ncbi:MAG: HNH endonuclease signature motif containing protein [Bdellovibrionota bacterium]